MFKILCFFFTDILTLNFQPRKSFKEKNIKYNALLFCRFKLKYEKKSAFSLFPATFYVVFILFSALPSFCFHTAANGSKEIGVLKLLIANCKQNNMNGIYARLCIIFPYQKPFVDTRAWNLNS